ncbi:MAG: PilZ domain-containing protein [Nitrospiria bacterium]
MLNEKRYPRFPMSGLVFGKVREPVIQFSGTLELISLSGIGIYTREKIEKGVVVDLNIVTSDGSHSIDVRITGVITNTERLQEFGILGVQFDRLINSDNHSYLYNYLVNEARKLGKG